MNSIEKTNQNVAKVPLRKSPKYVLKKYLKNIVVINARFSMQRNYCIQYSDLNVEKNIYASRRDSSVERAASAASLSE